MITARTGEIVWYATGRFYANTVKGVTVLQDVGYFPYLRGVKRDTSEKTALLTFASDPFESSKFSNGELGITIDDKGAFRLFLRERPGATFEDPSTFAQGRCIATFERTSVVVTTDVGGTLLTNVFTARLVSSEPFQLDGRRHDIAELVGYGITQWGTAAEDASFVGSAIRIG